MRKIYLLMLMLVMIVPVFAQEDAVIDRVLNSTTPDEAYQSYTALWTFKSGNVVSVDFAGMSLELTSSVDAEATIQATLGDNPNALVMLTYTVEEADDSGLVTYTIEAEARYVDGNLYINAAYVDGVGPYDIRGEWVQVDDLENFPEFDFFSDVFEVFQSETDVNLETVLDFATSISVEPTELNETEVDSVIITFGWQGLENLLDSLGAGLSLESDNPIAATLIQELSNSDDDLLTLMLLLDDNNVQVGRGVSVNLALADLDASVLDPTLEGTDATVSVELTSAENTVILEANEVYAPVEAPQLAN
ncbi:MAG: hypothetical protein D6711_13735 [Chloroflexi bacterium]|nr:MAG: hypothetical protein D6711_13735 [Chloroflexota bacterium]